MTDAKARKQLTPQQRETNRAAALRENLRKRKAQQQTAQTPEPKSSAPES